MYYDTVPCKENSYHRLFYHVSWIWFITFRGQQLVTIYNFDDFQTNSLYNCVIYLDSIRLLAEFKFYRVLNIHDEFVSYKLQWYSNVREWLILFFFVRMQRISLPVLWIRVQLAFTSWLQLSIIINTDFPNKSTPTRTVMYIDGSTISHTV